MLVNSGLVGRNPEDSLSLLLVAALLPPPLQVVVFLAARGPLLRRSTKDWL